MIAETIMPGSPTDVTELLVAVGDDADAMDRLLPLIYDELRVLAHRQRRQERRGHTLNTTALVHEAYMKLVDNKRASWENRAHFFGAAARAMRQILVDYARSRSRQKRGGGIPNLNLDDVPSVAQETEQDERLLALDEALSRLERLDPRQSRVVECRYFGGMTVEETAAALGISSSTVKREWATARLWLFRAIQDD